MPSASPAATQVRPATPSRALPTDAPPAAGLPHGRSTRLTLESLLSPVVELRPPYSRARLGTRTWDALVRDGDVVELWDGHGLPPGMRATPELRARSLLEHVPRDVVVGRRTAAWVHTGYPRPVRLCVLYAARGYRPRRTTGLDISQAALRPWDVEQLGGLRVTDLTRTALDVATWGSPEEAHPVLAVLLDHGLDLDECLQRLDRVASWRGADVARTTLGAAATQARAARSAATVAAGPVRVERVRTLRLP